MWKAKRRKGMKGMADQDRSENGMRGKEKRRGENWSGRGKVTQ